MSSVVDWHCFDGYPDPNPTFHFDAAPDVGNQEKNLFFIYSQQLSVFIVFNLLVSVIGFIIFIFFGQYFEIFWKTV